MVRGKTVQRGEAKKADYILFYKPNIPIAVVEAKDNNHSVGAGCSRLWIMPRRSMFRSLTVQTATDSLNTIGPGRLRRLNADLALEDFPSPAELWGRFRSFKGYSEEQEAVTTQDYYDDGSGKAPHYYQQVAINRTVDSIARGENRILLVMATGTGKTYTAFQIIWRLWKVGR